MQSLMKKGKKIVWISFRFFKSKRVFSQKCGEQASLVLAVIIINMKVAVKVMRHWLHFLQEQMQLLYTSVVI